MNCKHALGGVDFNQAIDRRGLTPAYIAAHKGHVDFLEALTKAEGVDFNQAIDTGDTPALTVAHNGHVDAMKVLIKAGADLNKATNRGAPPAFIAALNGRTNVLKLFLEVPGVNLSQYVSLPGTLLTSAVSSGGAEALARLQHFVSDNQRIAEQGNISVSPMDIAYIMGHEEIIEHFIFLERKEQFVFNTAEELKAIKDSCFEVSGLRSLSLFEEQSFEQQFAEQLLLRMRYEDRIEPCLLQYAFSPSSIREVITSIRTKGYQDSQDVEAIIPKMIQNFIEKVRAGIDADFVESETPFQSI